MPLAARPSARLQLFVVLAVGFNLRPALTGLAPVLPEIMRDTGLGGTGASLLGALPVACLGLFALLGPRLAARVGLQGAVLLVLAVLTAGLALRGIPSLVPLFAGSLLAGAAIGAGNMLMPAMLKRDFPDRPGLLSGLYVAALCLGAAISAGTAVPVAEHAGSWAAALGIWAAPAALALALAAWAWRGAWRRPTNSAPDAPGLRPLLSQPLAWQVTLYMGLQSTLAYGYFAWLAPLLRSRGDDPRTAGLVVSVSVLAQMAASLPAPLIAARLRRQSVPAAACTLLLGLCFAGLVAAPLRWQWPLAIGLGAGSGGAFALAIMLMLLRSPDAATAARLSGLAQGVGYSVAALGPLLVGLLHDATGTWDGAALLFLTVGAAASLSGALAGRPLLLRTAPPRPAANRALE